MGRTLDAANLQLLRRHVREAVMDDPLVGEILRLDVQPRPRQPGTVEVRVVLRAAPPAPQRPVELGVVLDAG